MALLSNSPVLDFLYLIVEAATSKADSSSGTVGGVKLAASNGFGSIFMKAGTRSVLS